MRLRDKDGVWIPVEVEASNLLDNPAVGGIVVGFRDIRERLRAESELRESEARLRTLVKNIPGAVYRCEATPPYADEFVSEAVFALTGYTAEQFLARRGALRRADPARPPRAHRPGARGRARAPAARS